MIDIQNLADYSANNLELTLSPSTISHEGFWPRGAVSPYAGPWKNTYKELYWLVEFRGSRESIEKNKSKLFKDLLDEGAITDGPFLYRGNFVSEGVQETFRGFEVVAYQGKVIHLGEETMLAISGTKAITNTGTGLTPIKLTLTGGPGTISINGKLVATASLDGQTLIIDTAKGEVKTGTGTSAIGLVPDLIGLPYLSPGINEIVLTGGLVGSLVYRPVYI